MEHRDDDGDWVEALDGALQMRAVKHFGRLFEHLRPLYDDPKREFHYDQLALLLLLFYFNPILESQRDLVRATKSRRVAKRVGLAHGVSAGSFVEAAQHFDAAHLEDLVRALVARVREKLGPRPVDLAIPAGLELVAVDGTFWSALPRMFPQHWKGRAKSGRPPGLTSLTVYSVTYGVPTDANVKLGYANEHTLFADRLETGVLYLLDAGFIDFELWQKILDRPSSFIVRVHDAVVAETLESRPLSAAALAAGVLSDTIVQVGSEPHRGKLCQPLRRVEAEVTLPPPTNLVLKRRGDVARATPQKMKVVVFTDLLDVPAEVIIQCYRLRWQIEIFFRWLKKHARCQHLICESENGLRLQVLMALIASLVLALLTGALPTRGILKALQMYFAGWYDTEDVLRLVQEEAEKTTRREA
jgi:hypothetical protein